MLSQKVINKILEIGFYFDDEFDFDKNEVILTQESREWFKNNLGLEHIDSAFVDYYSFAIGGNGRGEELYDLERIMKEMKQPFCMWEKYPQIGKRYLQLSSIEGQGSYFYDKETDALYDVGWDEMDDFMAGKLKPLFTSFYDFLEWYYSEEDED